MVRSVLLAACLVVVATLTPVFAVHASGSIGDDQADAVWGQPNFFQNDPSGGTSGSCPVSTTAANLCNPFQIALDGSGNLWVADASDSRVLMYPPGSTTATKVFGQAGSFTTTSQNTGGLSASSLWLPGGVAIDGNGTLFVADSSNNRVLVYFHAATKPSSPSADLVLGQPDFTSNTANNPASTTPLICQGRSCFQTCPAPVAANACTLDQPHSLSVDSAGDLLVGDFNNSRVLLFPASELAPSNPNGYTCSSSCDIPATMVWGQYGSFLTNGQNESHSQGSNDPCITTTGTPTACTLKWPSDAIADAQGNLYISDQGNNRVLEYDGALAPGATNYRQLATMVYGQAGSFTSGVANNGGVSASSFDAPEDLALDPAGDLWVSDVITSRVLEFPPPVTANRTAATTAIQVLGERGSFTQNATNNGGLDAGALSWPRGIAFDGSGNLYVADQNNNRVLEYLQPYPISARIGLAAGWNLLALPSTTALPYSAASVVTQVNQEGGNASEVAVYANGRYQVFVPGYASDFGIGAKQGFWVLATKASTWALT